MSRFEFTVRGLTRSRVRQLRRTLSPRIGHGGAGVSPVKLVVLPLVVVAAVAVLADPSVVVSGLSIRANELLLFIDDSESMSQFRTETNEALNAIRSDGIALDDSIPIGGSASGILEHFRRELDARPRVDAVYMVSDFNDASDLIAGTDSTGYRTLLRLLRQRGIRLYLSTVNLTPCPDHVSLARATGGGWNSLAVSGNPSSDRCP